MSRLDDKGCCCGRKPLHYRSGATTTLRHPHKFCTRCDRAFDVETGEQIENWAWISTADGSFVPKRPVRSPLAIAG